MLQTVLKSGNFNVLELSRPVQACNGIDLPLLVFLLILLGANKELGVTVGTDYNYNLYS
jgi:hypothetical protein